MDKRYVEAYTEQTVAEYHTRQAEANLLNAKKALLSAKAKLREDERKHIEPLFAKMLGKRTRTHGSQ